MVKNPRSFPLISISTPLSIVLIFAFLYGIVQQSIAIYIVLVSLLFGWCWYQIYPEDEPLHEDDSKKE